MSVQGSQFEGSVGKSIGSSSKPVESQGKKEVKGQGNVQRCSLWGRLRSFTTGYGTEKLKSNGFKLERARTERSSPRKKNKEPQLNSKKLQQLKQPKHHRILSKDDSYLGELKMIGKGLDRGRKTLGFGRLVHGRTSTAKLEATLKQELGAVLWKDLEGQLKGVSDDTQRRKILKSAFGRLVERRKEEGSKTESVAKRRSKIIERSGSFTIEDRNSKKEVSKFLRNLSSELRSGGDSKAVCERYLLSLRIHEDLRSYQGDKFAFLSDLAQNKESFLSSGQKQTLRDVMIDPEFEALGSLIPHEQAWGILKEILKTGDLIVLDAFAQAYSTEDKPEQKLERAVGFLIDEEQTQTQENNSLPPDSVLFKLDTERGIKEALLNIIPETQEEDGEEEKLQEKQEEKKSDYLKEETRVREEKTEELKLSEKKEKAPKPQIGTQKSQEQKGARTRAFTKRTEPSQRNDPPPPFPEWLPEYLAKRNPQMNFYPQKQEHIPLENLDKRKTAFV